MTLRTFVSRHRRSVIITGIVALLLAGGIVLLNRPKKPQYVTAPVVRGDVVQTVEAVGTVASERELELRFAGIGIVSSVSVKEGDRVYAGQRLAALRSGGLSANVASQSAALQSALADLQAIEEGNRPEDIAVEQAQVENKQAALDAAKSSLQTATDSIAQEKDKVTVLQQEAQTTLSGQVDTARSTLSQQLVAGQNALASIDDVLGKTIVQDAVIKFRPGADSDIIANKNKALDGIGAAQKEGTNATDYHTALDALSKANAALQNAQSAIDQAYSLIIALPETNYFKNSDRETYKNTLETSRSQMQTASAALSAAFTSFQSASATYDTRLTAEQASMVAAQGAKATAEANVRTYQTALDTEKANLALKQAGPRSTDVDAARARVRAEQANLARAESDYSDTILVAPIAGTVTHVKIRIGEGLPAGAAVAMIGDSPFRTEMFVSEIDVPKVMLSQSGSVELDAFRGTHFQLRVSEVDAAATNKDGVSKYRVELDFLHPHPELKIGMTGDSTITTGIRKNALSVPRRAVLEDTDGHQYVRILQKDGTAANQSVTTGMEGASGDIEILSGLKEDETVVVLTK